jgi:hypothetical protein
MRGRAAHIEPVSTISEGVTLRKERVDDDSTIAAVLQKEHEFRTIHRKPLLM